MRVELFIAKRIFKGDKKNEKNVSSPAVRIAIAGIALGLAVMIVSVCVIVGFKKEIRDKIVGFGSHIQITSSYSQTATYENLPISYSDTLVNLIMSNPQIKSIQPFITKPAIIKTDEDFQGVVLKGVNKDFDWEFFQKNMVAGKVLQPNDTTDSNQAIISKYIADKLHLKLGDRFTTYFIQEPVRARRFTITGIYETNFEQYDKMYAITDINILAKLNNWDADMVSGVELMVNDFDKLDQTTQELFFALSDYKDRLDNSLYPLSIKNINPIIFNWLDLLDVNVWVIIILMIIVSGFTMISGLLIIILERTNMIGILKAVGARNFSIRKVFLYLSAFLIGKGMIWGNIIGLSICFIQDKFQILKLDPITYYLSAVPIEMNFLHLILLNIGTLIVTLIMMIGPSYLVSKITPVKSIKFE